MQDFNITGITTRTIPASPVYQPVNPIQFWSIPVNIGTIKQCAACLTSLTKHIGKVQGIGLSLPRTKRLLSGSEGDRPSPSDSAEDVHAGNIGNIKLCVGIMRTFIFLSAQKRGQGNCIQSPVSDTASAAASYP
uniref:Uncharacterized protein n=1 Tax=virus sp. ct5rm7 TaxID=2827298 RepID=A0A8S5RG24_9VIRU|nr:MAG TPA: hypothetical protein [virus sp. ct5rm7]